MEPCSVPTLVRRLAEALPRDLRLTVHHLSSFPAPCPAIFSPAPQEDEEPTQCESHFLSLAIDVNGTKVQVFAIEVLIYTTDTLTTLFVSKADSTGYLHLLNIPIGTPSPLRTVVSTFLTYLVDTRKRDGIRLVLSFFARAQNQYLFPGSIENPHKHVLDDRGLIKWWCKILDDILRKYPVGTISTEPRESSSHRDPSSFTSLGYLRVPGCDFYETKAFFPASARHDSPSHPLWHPTDPLRALGNPPTVPERSLIPRFPDDPKARFVIDLDDELPDTSSQQIQDSPSKHREAGQWRSVRSLEQFWEMMAFRQECAAGRLVGFIWGVFTPGELVGRPFETQAENSNLLTKQVQPLDPVLLTPLPSQIPNDPLLAPESPLRSSSSSQALLLSPVSPSQSRQLEPPSSPVLAPLTPHAMASTLASQPTPQPLPPPLAPAIGPTELSLPLRAYARCISLLERLDYADVDTATDSTRKWLEAVAEEAGVREWGVGVVGTRAPSAGNGFNMVDRNGSCMANGGVVNGNGDCVAVLGTDFVRRKKRPAGEGTVEDSGSANGDEVRTLEVGLVRKKPKIVNDQT